MSPCQSVSSPRLGKRTCALFVALFLVASSLAAFRGKSSEQPAEKTTPAIVRKNVKDLTAAEKAELVAAIKKLKTMSGPINPKRYKSYYDELVSYHLEIHRCGYSGHMAPSFLPWHRAYVMAYEQALAKAAGKPIAAPYWDWTDPESTKAVFANDFMGPISGKKEDDYAVTSGPFRKGQWEVTLFGPPSDDPAQFPYLVRAAGTSPTAKELPKPDELEAALKISTYDVDPYNLSSDPNNSFRQNLEGWIGWEGRGQCVDMIDQPTPGKDLSKVALTNHNKTHHYIGGVFKPSDKVRLHGEGYSAKLLGLKGHVYGTIVPATAPNDPAFWLLHSNVDRVWAAWQEKHPNAYVPKENGPAGQNLEDTLAFFKGVIKTYTIGSVQDISKLGYTYDKLPRVP